MASAVQVLKILRGEGQGGDNVGLKVIRVVTTEPDPITFVFEGTELPLDLEIFEVPVDFYPLAKGDRFLGFPLIGLGASQRWGLIQKINGGQPIGTMDGSLALTFPGIAKKYTGYLFPKDMIFLSGDKVAVAPVLAGEKINYVVLNRL